MMKLLKCLSTTLRRETALCFGIESPQSQWYNNFNHKTCDFSNYRSCAILRSLCIQVGTKVVNNRAPFPTSKVWMIAKTRSIWVKSKIWCKFTVKHLVMQCGCLTWSGFFYETILMGSRIPDRGSYNALSPNLKFNPTSLQLNKRKHHMTVYVRRWHVVGITWRLLQIAAASCTLGI